MKKFILSLFLVVAGISAAQTPTTGDIAGRITDPTGAAVHGAVVTLKSLDEGEVQTVKTDRTGAFRFPLLRPGTYKVHEEGSGMKADAVVAVNVGQATPLNLVAKPNGGETIVDVNGEPLLQTEDANISTTFSQHQVESLPIPGGDLTNLPFSTPGVNIATGDDYGNFTVFGISGDSNLFTTNGSDIMDAYDNLAATGSSNNALGANEVQEAAVVVNGYTGQYGKLAGAQVNFTTKSGTNSFHGNAILYYNSSGFNANDWFLKKNEIGSGLANTQPHAVSRQWGGSVGGPIWKDKVFFFFDDEGLRYVLPGGGGSVYVPSTAFQTATLSNIAATQPAESAFYQNLFKIYNGSSGFASSQTATPAHTGGNITDGGCGAVNGLTLQGTTFGPNTPCANFFTSQNNSVNTEQLYTIRVDANLGAKDQFNARYKHDWGVQATSTDPLNPLFSAISNQPEYEGQVNETHIFSPNLVNTFTAATSYYDAVFGPQNLGGAFALFPTTFNFSDGAGFYSLASGLNSYPSGRDVSVYQFSDDLSITKGIHNIKIGYNFRRDNITYISTQAGKNGSTTFASNLDFYNGMITKTGGSTTTQAFPFIGPAHENFYTISVYAQDQAALSPKFKLTASLRFDRFGDPACGGNCFVRTNGPFDSLTHSTTANQLPYTQAIITGQRNAFSSTESVTIQPRVGFAFSPFGPSGKTVIRGGGGLFADLPVAALVGRFAVGAPNVATFQITPSATTSYTVVPGLANSSYNAAAASAGAFHTGFYSGETLPQLQAAVAAAGSTYSAPTYSASGPNKLLNPKFVEYNLEVQQALTRHDSIDINYVGNYGFDILLFNPTVNAYASCYPTICPNGFPGLPNAPIDNRFTSVSEITNNGHSNFNGIVTSFKHLGGYGVTTTINYEFGHALDNTSNGGYLPDQGEATAVQTQIDPTSPDRLNYGNADYDNRHNLTANVVWTPPVKFSNRYLQSGLSGWTIAATMFAKSAVPYTVVRGSLASYFTSSTNGGSTLGAFLGGSKTGPCKNPRTTCLTLSQFAATTTATRAQQIPYGFGNLARNSFRGPSYFDSDMQISKTTTIKESVKFKFGANIFNVLNHPNFAPPGNNIATASTFGTVNADLPPVSSPYGNFQGAGVSGRIIQVLGGITF